MRCRRHRTLCGACNCMHQALPTVLTCKFDEVCDAGCAGLRACAGDGDDGLMMAELRVTYGAAARDRSWPFIQFSIENHRALTIMTCGSVFNASKGAHSSWMKRSTLPANCENRAIIMRRYRLLVAALLLPLVGTCWGSGRVDTAPTE